MAATTETALPLPSYFSREFFEKSFETQKVVDFSAKLALGKGENYMSTLYRVSVRTLDGVTRSLIVKCCPEEGKMKEFLDKSGVFKKETLALAKVGPKASEMLRMAGLETKLCPDLKYFRDEPAPCMILEDLSESGYRLADRKTGLDLHHCKMVMEKLAKLHAAGKMLYEKNATDLAQFASSFYDDDRNSDGLSSYYNASSNSIVGLMKTEWGPEHKALADKLDKVKQKAIKKCSLVVRKDCEFKVFVHGDFWANNIMFRYGKEQEPEDVVMVDFQCSFYGSPANDLHYFLATSVSEDVFWNSRDELVQHYHQSLTATLAALGYTGTIPTLEELLEEMKICYFIAISALICVKPIVMFDSADGTGEISDMVGGSDAGAQAMRKMHSNPKFVQVFKRRLDYYDRQGMLD